MSGRAIGWAGLNEVEGGSVLTGLVNGLKDGDLKIEKMNGVSWENGGIGNVRIPPWLSLTSPSTCG